MLRGWRLVWRQLTPALHRHISTCSLALHDKPHRHLDLARITADRKALDLLVHEYWENLAHYVSEPGFPPLSMRSVMKSPTPAKLREILETVVSTRPAGPMQGDLLPTLYVQQCCQMYKSLDEQHGKQEFFEVLASDFGVPSDESQSSAKAVLDAHASGSRKALLRAQQLLRHTMEPRHNIFFDLVNQLPGGTKFLIDLRADLLQIIAKTKSTPNDELLALNDNFKEKLQHLLFGFLTLERITWTSPAALLEKMSQNEAVHAVADWKDMKRRVGPGRRVYGFFFRNVPVEPLVFVHVALTDHIEGNVQNILKGLTKTPEHRNDITTAIFYSISSQRGLAGIELGTFLIKRVVRTLQNEFPHIHTYTTLSPIPMFRSWLLGEQNGGGGYIDREQDFLTEDEAKRFSQAFGKPATRDYFKACVTDPSWTRNEQQSAALKPILLRLCAQYILLEKRGKLALDPVANFHLRNGACAQRLNWRGDVSNNGFQTSFGIMINYNYIVDFIESNNQQYLERGTISVSEVDNGYLTKCTEAASNLNKISGSRKSV
ncbi:hypothetical protein BZG36_03043 [Bifiguratus adelaidae]|uniref:Malonyl-CoA decarboxylase C-terminal domain-containing protein n=1 Tax=Bifiguratus adelaidae TaxID=1938954 RepID=A0A261XYX9_9FUNG|nr:hypothetical protein BZG36_03043 [Bifiguratus adelaidae]